MMAWWKKNYNFYPILSLRQGIFSQFMCTVSSELAFGRILDNNGTSHSPETLEALNCTKDWLI
jgi:hypothetical protein